MNADQTACAFSGKASARDQIGWPKSERLVRRLQARIVKVTRAIPALTGPVHAGLCNGLSRMKGNFHVRFLGEGVAATSPPYPTIERSAPMMPDWKQDVIARSLNAIAGWTSPGPLFAFSFL